MKPDDERGIYQTKVSTIPSYRTGAMEDDVCSLLELSLGPCEISYGVRQHARPESISKRAP
jgi:hypothetical protein